MFASLSRVGADIKNECIAKKAAVCRSRRIRCRGPQPRFFPPRGGRTRDDTVSALLLFHIVLSDCALCDRVGVI